MVGTKRKTERKKKIEGRYGRFKSRSKKLKYVKTPGGKTTIHYKNKKKSKAKCADCGKTLHGTLKKNTSKMRKGPKTSKRPERPYGGYLCSKCMREKIKKGARKND